MTLYDPNPIDDQPFARHKPVITPAVAELKRTDNDSFGALSQRN